MQFTYESNCDIELTPYGREMFAAMARDAEKGVYRVTATYPRKAWEFPRDRFVEYEPSDEAWARPLGFGKEVDRMFTLEIPRAIVVPGENGLAIRCLPAFPGSMEFVL